jgi:hypothetical protein
MAVPSKPDYPVVEKASWEANNYPRSRPPAILAASPGNYGGLDGFPVFFRVFGLETAGP